MEGIQYRPYDKKRDLPGFLYLFHKVFGFAVDGNYFEWKYYQNPGGTCHLRAAVNDRGEMIGFAALTPYKFWINGSQKLAAQGADTMVHPDHRKKGVFTALTGNLLEILARENMCFRYSAPGPMSYPGYLKLGSETVCRMPHLFRLNIKNKLFSRRYSPEKKESADSAVIFREDRFTLQAVERADGSFDALDRETASLSGIRIQRDSAFVNWRLIGNPLKPCKVLGFFRHEELLGYAAVRSGYLVDLLYGKDEKHLELFIKWVARYLDTKGIILSETWFSGDERITKHLRKSGFRSDGWDGLKRALSMMEGYPLIVHINEKECEPVLIRNAANWYITMANIDCM